MVGTVAEGPVAQLERVEVARAGHTILGPIDLTIGPAEDWVILGPNGSGKSTLVAVLTLALHPTQGEVTVLGNRLGRCDLRAVRPRIGVASAELADRLRPGLTGLEIVMTALRGALEPWWHDYGPTEQRAAGDALDRTGAGALSDRTFATMSSGERQRVLIARALVTGPDLLVLDEPAAGLDLGGREDIFETLDRLAGDVDGPPVTLVTHHVEEIPSGFSHALILCDGQTVTSGPIAAALTSASVSAAFGRRIEIGRFRDRFWARGYGSSG